METLKQLVIVRKDGQEAHTKFLGQLNYSVWYCNDGYMLSYLSKPKECRTPRINPNISHELRVIMMCHCRLIYCIKCIPVVWGGGMPTLQEVVCVCDRRDPRIPGGSILGSCKKRIFTNIQRMQSLSSHHHLLILQRKPCSKEIILW